MRSPDFQKDSHLTLSGFLFNSLNCYQTDHLALGLITHTVVDVQHKTKDDDICTQHPSKPKHVGGCMTTLRQQTSMYQIMFMTELQP